MKTKRQTDAETVKQAQTLARWVREGKATLSHALAFVADLADGGNVTAAQAEKMREVVNAAR